MECDPEFPVADSLLNTLYQLVDSVSANNATQIHLESGAAFARLKSVNRSANAAIRARRHTSAEARVAMDQTHLKLQNLLYERRHLEREIEKCNQFASIYQDVALQPMDEFLELAPDDAKEPSVLADEHQLMLNRLSFELAERQRLEEKQRSLTAEKDARMKEYREQEKLVNEWFSSGTGVERAVADLQLKGTKLASKLGLNPSPLSRENTPMEVEEASPPVVTVAEPPKPTASPGPHIPTGPRLRT